MSDKIEISDIKKDFPKSWDLLKKTLTGVEEVKGQEEAFIEIALVNAPRVFLYDFFDKNQVYISIGTDLTPEGKCIFTYAIEETEEGYYEKAKNSRADVEAQAWLSAFKILESKLNKNG